MKCMGEFTLEAASISLEHLDPSFRKATMNMTLATLSCEHVLQKLPQNISKDQISFIIGTHFGEVDSTLTFLSTYYETKTPRPILFQNSLHNSTLGFVSIKLGLCGPAMTVSCDAETQSASIQLAETMLHLTPYVLLCFVDCIPDLLAPKYLTFFPFLNNYLNKATSYLFCKNE